MAKYEQKKKEIAGKGRIFERTMHGGWEKVRGDVTKADFDKSYQRKHSIGAVKGKPMYRFQPNK